MVLTQISSDFKPKRGCKPTENAQTNTLCVTKLHAQLAKVGAMPQFCVLFYAIIQSCQTKGRAMAHVFIYDVKSDKHRDGQRLQNV